MLILNKNSFTANLLYYYNFSMKSHFFQFAVVDYLTLASYNNQTNSTSIMDCTTTTTTSCFTSTKPSRLKNVLLFYQHIFILLLGLREVFFNIFYCYTIIKTRKTQFHILALCPKMTDCNFDPENVNLPSSNNNRSFSVQMTSYIPNRGTH